MGLANGVVQFLDKIGRAKDIRVNNITIVH